MPVIPDGVLPVSMVMPAVTEKMLSVPGDDNLYLT